MIDPVARARLLQKQQADAIIKEIKNNTPQIPEIPEVDLNPLRETLDKNLTDTNGIGEDALSFSALNFEMLTNIDESLLEMVDLLKELKDTLSPKTEIPSDEKTDIIEEA